MQMDLGSTKLVAGTVIQPRVGNTQYVTQYTVKTSIDQKSWSDAPGTFGGNNKETRENKFDKGVLIRARFVRIYVKKGVATFRCGPTFSLLEEQSRKQP